MSDHDLPSPTASFPPPPRSTADLEGGSTPPHLHPEATEEGGVCQDDLLMTVSSRLSRRATPVSPYNGDHQVEITGASDDEKANDQPALSNFIASMHKPQRSFIRGKNPVTELVWNGLTIRSRANRQGQARTLLDNVSGKLSYGLTALMGPSGSGHNTPATLIIPPPLSFTPLPLSSHLPLSLPSSGKTTLLNSLACRLDVNTTQEGDIWLNGESYSNAELKRVAGYVMQDDLLNAHLTVQETLMYAAQLRLPSDWTMDQKSQRVDEVIYDMGLESCRHVLIGNTEMKGISGGQKRRVCVCVQLLTRPQLLFLDEPTSGLDSVTAFELVTTLFNLSQNLGCTVVASIHQPQSKIYAMFTHLILLKDGHVMYQGKRSMAIDTFTAAGFPLPPLTNPADHLMDVITTTNQTTKEQELAISTALSLACADNPLLTTTQSASRPKVLAKVISETEYARNRLGWSAQTAILFRRSMQEQWRKRRVTLISLAQSLLMAVLIGTAFLSIGNSQVSINKRQSVLFFCVVNQGVFGALMVINSFPSERSLTLRERASGTYFVSSYFTAKMMAETVTQLPIPILFSFTAYWLIGFANTASQFLIFMAFMILCSLAATSLALMVSALSRTIDLSVTILPLVLEVSRLFGGFFLSPAQLPKYFSWLDALSYIKYTYVGISLNELDGLTYQCTTAQAASGTAICTGAQEASALGLTYISIGGCAGALLGYIIFTRIVAFLAVRQLKA